MSYETYDNDHVTVGPWGGQTGARWDDGLFSSVKQIVICHGAAIDSIQIEYDKKGYLVWSDKHGGTGGFKTNKVKFNNPDEFLVSISGYYGSTRDYGPVLVLSLTFESNKKKYGPFGIPEGTHFSFPMTGGMVVGFHGRSSWSLDSIGVHLKPVLIQNPPNNFIASPNYARNGITAETKGSEIAMVSEKKDNIFVPNQSLHQVEAKDEIWDNPKTYQSEITHRKSSYSGSSILRKTTVAKSTTFHASRRTYEPYGDVQGITFTSGLNDGIIAGFPDVLASHVIEGKPPLPWPFNDSFHMTDTGKGWFADSFGAFIEEKPPLPRPSNDSFNKTEAGKGRFDGFGAHIIEEKLSLPRPSNDSISMTDRKIPQSFPGMVKEQPAWFSSGPWGGNGGKRWDDGVFSGVKKIFLFSGEAIYSIQIEYDRNGQSFLSDRHGGGNEGTSYMITFQHPHEVLTGLCGYYESLTGDERSNVVRALTFFTNKGKYGPVGEETGIFFTWMKTEGKIVGFHGKSSCYLNSIGVHVQM